MPMKFKKSDIVRQKDGSSKTTHYYIKQETTEMLLKYINGEERCKPKQRRKCIVELDRRNIAYVWSPVQITPESLSL